MASEFWILCLALISSQDGAPEISPLVSAQNLCDCLVTTESAPGFLDALPLLVASTFLGGST